jgi:hypothetical protein
MERSSGFHVIVRSWFWSEGESGRSNRFRAVSRLVQIS